MPKQSFSSGQTLLSSQMNDLQTNDFNQTVSTKTDAYTFVVGDRGTRVVLNDTTARTFTIDDAIFSAGDTIQVHNINTGVLTIAAGAGVTLNGADVLTVAQYQGGTIFFTSASSAIFFPTAKTVADSGLTLISSTTIGSAVSSVTVSDAFSATYDNYRIMLNGGVASTNIEIQLQLGATTSGYRENLMFMTTDSTTITGANTNAGANFIVAGYGSVNTLNARIDLFGPNLAKNTIMHFQAVRSTDAGRNAVGQGMLVDTTAYTAFTLIASTGTMTGGTIKVYGYQN